MFQNIGYITLCFLIVFLSLKGILLVLENDYGIEIPTGQKIFISENKGEDWMAVKESHEGIKGVANFAFDFENSSNIYLASAKGILKSTDGGGKFKAQDTTFETEVKPSLISEFVSNPQNSDIIYLISEEMGKNKLLVSNNGGETFKSIYISGTGDEITAFAPDPFFPQYLYIGTEKGLFLKSDDFGNSWDKKQIFSREISQIAVNPHKGFKNREIYVILASFRSNTFSPMSRSYQPARILVSANWGENFKNFRGDIGEVNEIVFDPNIKNRIYFISKASVKRLSGSSLEALNLILPSVEDEIHSFTIDPKNSNILYLGAGELLYISENEGENWRVIEPPTKGEVKEVKINPADSNTLLLSVTEIW